MKSEEIMQRSDFKRCQAFHGHICPGLALGYRSARAALDWLGADRAEDEEVVAVVESDACSADAVQTLTGCTFGKGNFIFRDYGKMALTLFSRRTGQGVRVALKPGAFQPDEAHQALMAKISSGDASPAERDRFDRLHLHLTREVLAASADSLFTIVPVSEALPDRAQVQPSRNCARCGEPTMPAKMERVAGQWWCRGCQGAAAVV